MSALGTHLRRERIARGLTLRDIERRSDGKVSNAYLSQIETGAVENPSLAIVFAATKAIGLNFQEVAEIAVGDRELEMRLCPTCGQPT